MCTLCGSWAQHTEPTLLVRGATLRMCDALGNELQFSRNGRRTHFRSVLCVSSHVGAVYAKFSEVIQPSLKTWQRKTSHHLRVSWANFKTLLCLGRCTTPPFAVQCVCNSLRGPLTEGSSTLCKIIDERMLRAFLSVNFSSGQSSCFWPPCSPRGSPWPFLPVLEALCTSPLNQPNSATSDILLQLTSTCRASPETGATRMTRSKKYILKLNTFPRATQDRGVAQASSERSLHTRALMFQFVFFCFEKKALVHYTR